jgi:hypothetical protein
MNVLTLNDYAWILFVVVILLLHPFEHIPNRIRASKLHQLAKKYNLNYSYGDGIKFTFFRRPSYKRNFISGKIGNHTIEFHDLLTPHISALNNSMVNYLQDSVLTIDSKFYNFFGDSQTPRSVSVKLLESKLAELHKTE